MAEAPKLLWLLCVVMVLAGCKTRTWHTAAEGALGPYSGSVIGSGLCFVSGKIGTRGEGFEVEARTAIDAVERELERVGLTLADVLQATVYLTDIGNYGVFNDIYGERFPRPYPARAVVEVPALPGDAQVEIQVIARRD